MNEETERSHINNESRLNDLKPVRAWDRPMSFDVPTSPFIKSDGILRYEQRTVPIKYAVESVYEGAANARDRILARGILSIMEEMEFHTGPLRKERK